MAGVRGAIVGVCAAGLLGLPASSRAAAGGSDDWATGPVRIEGFEVEPVARLEPGVQIPFTLYGSPGATATLRIDGARAPLALREIYGGVYEGRYIVRPGDRIAPNAGATASLRRGGEVTTARLEEPLVDGAAPIVSTPPPAGVVQPVPPASAVAEAPASSAAEATVACADCAVVEAVDAVEPARRGVPGVIIGGLLGGLVADRAADGPHRHLARLLGAVGGAFAGHAIATRGVAVAHYEVRFRLPDGRTQVRRYTGAPPPWRLGDVVRVDAALPHLRAGGRSAEPGF